MITEFGIGNNVVKIEIPERLSNNCGSLPKNFGMVISGKIYRGGWPKTIKPLFDLGVNNIITLYCASCGNEPDKTNELAKEISKCNGISHFCWNITNEESFIDIAKKIIELQGVSYVHCSAGANRTGIVSILTQIYYYSKIGKKINQNEITKFLRNALQHGFDYDKKEYMNVLENLLNRLLNEKFFTLKN